MKKFLISYFLFFISYFSFAQTDGLQMLSNKLVGEHEKSKAPVNDTRRWSW